MSRVATLSVSREQTRQVSQSSAHRLRWMKLRYVAVIAVCGWALYHYWHTQQPQLAALMAKQNQLQSQLNAMEKSKVELTAQSQQLQDKDYIARYASEHDNLILPGQVAFDVK